MSLFAAPLLNAHAPEYLKYCGQPGTFEPTWTTSAGWQAHTCIGREQWLSLSLVFLLALVLLGIYVRHRRAARRIASDTVSKTA